MIQRGPTTGEFAIVRKVQKQTCTDIVVALQEAAGISSEQATAMIVMIGLSAMDFLRASAEKRSDDSKVSDLVVEACLAGFGWSGMASFYRLDLDYVHLLDELNEMKVKDDNDLPPTKEKG